jgi:hypothetical protein
MRRHAASIGLALLMLVGLPRAGSAGVLDIIWELSGPRMVGYGLYCRFTLDGKSVSCLPGRQEQALLAQAENHRPWIATEGYFYFSIPKNGFSNGDVYMLALEPSVEIPLTKYGDTLFYSGAGITYDGLFGPAFFAFDNFGYKVRPIAFQRKGWGVAYNIRFYPNDFAHDLFNPAVSASVPSDRPKEIIHTFSITIPF